MILKPDINDDQVVGQLGNKLFVIAAMIGWAKEHNDFFFIGDWKYSKYFPNLIKNTNSSVAGNIRGIYREPTFGYVPIPFTYDNIYLSGYFQSEKYFEHCKEDVKYYFTPDSETLKKAEEIVSRKFREKVCSIHVRRGDYLNPQTSDYHGNCGMDYYHNAMNKIKAKRYLIFSDDIQWCKENFIGKQYSFSENNTNIEDMVAMSLCDDHIIANSSFSWWGAWLNKSNKKRIVAPKEWFKSGPVDYSDVYTKDMIRL